MVSDLNHFAHEGCKSGGQKSFEKKKFHLFTLLKLLFAPTSQSPMSKLFRYSKSLEKSNGKKWSEIAHKWYNIATHLYIFFQQICLTSRIFWYWCYYPHRSGDALSPVCGIFLMFKSCQFGCRWHQNQVQLDYWGRLNGMLFGCLGHTS